MEVGKYGKSVKDHGQGTDILQVREWENRLGINVSAVNISWNGCLAWWENLGSGKQLCDCSVSMAGRGERVCEVDCAKFQALLSIAHSELAG